METTAIVRGVRLSAQKGRLVADLVRGKPVDKSLNILSFTQKKAAGIIRKALDSAIANAEHNIPLRHFVWNISERFMYKKYYNGDNRANFIKTLFPREFADTDIATIKNFKVDPSKTLIPIDEPENGSLDFHYPEDYAREMNS